MDISGTPRPPAASLRREAIRGFFWSAVENWGAKLFLFATSLILARILTPGEFGIASAAALVLLIVPVIAQFGFDAAITQRRDLRDVDLNLPFAFALGVSVVGTGAVAWFAPELVAALGMPGREWLFVAIAASAPLTIPLAFQEVVYRRALRFPALARRSLIASLVGGLGAIAAAVAGAGAWTFVIQTWIVLAVSCALIWSRPLWTPALRFDRTSFAELLRFGLPMQAQRLLDLAGSRAVDLAIIVHIGLAPYGLFVIASRMYQTMLQLLQGMLSTVSLTLLSRIADDRPRLADAYRETIANSAAAIAPIFVLFAAISPEICRTLFDRRWDGIEAIALPLFLLGALQSIQFSNGSFLLARGRPGLVLVAGAGRTVAILAALAASNADSVSAATLAFVVASAVTAPVSFGLTVRELRARADETALLILRPAIASVAGWILVELLRAPLSGILPGPLLLGAGLGASFAVAYLASLAIVDPAAARRLRRLADDAGGAVLAILRERRMRPAPLGKK
jgi:O-antigen/teichoic acid export membrane protein